MTDAGREHPEERLRLLRTAILPLRERGGPAAPARGVRRRHRASRAGAPPPSRPRLPTCCASARTSTSSTSPAGRAARRWRWSSAPAAGSRAWTPSPRALPGRVAQASSARACRPRHLRRRRLRRAAALRGRHLRGRPLHRRDLPPRRPLRHPGRVGPAASAGRPSPLHRPRGPDRCGRQERAGHPRLGGLLPLRPARPGTRRPSQGRASPCCAARTAPRPPP